MIAEIYYVGAWILAYTPFVEGYPEALKATIPARSRKWNPTERAWSISIEYERSFLMICEAFFHDIHVVRGSYQPPRQAPATNPYATLYLLPTAPPELVESAYRTLARMFHPDQNAASDATDRMKMVNIAYEQLKAGAA